MNSQSVSDDRIPLASAVSANRVQFIRFDGPTAWAINEEANRVFLAVQRLLVFRTNKLKNLAKTEKLVKLTS
jgi:hypothetical protein